MASENSRHDEHSAATISPNVRTTNAAVKKLVEDFVAASSATPGATQALRKMAPAFKDFPGGAAGGYSRIFYDFLIATAAPAGIDSDSMRSTQEALFTRMINGPPAIQIEVTVVDGERSKVAATAVLGALSNRLKELPDAIVVSPQDGKLYDVSVDVRVSSLIQPGGHQESVVASIVIAHHWRRSGVNTYSLLDLVKLDLLGAAHVMNSSAEATRTLEYWRPSLFREHIVDILEMDALDVFSKRWAQRVDAALFETRMSQSTIAALYQPRVNSSAGP